MKPNETRMREVRDTLKGPSPLWEFLFMASVLAFVLAVITFLKRA